jgi:tetratricopeptide (TPR) repeat protein
MEYWLGLACWALGANQSLLGEFAAAAEWLDRAEAIGEAARHPRVQTAAVFLRVSIGVRCGEWPAVIAEGRRWLERSVDPLAALILPVYLGTALCETGERAEGLALLERALEQLGPVTLVLWAWVAVSLGEGYLLSGRLDEARAVASQGLERASTLSLGYWVGLARRTLGRIALAAEDLGDAERELTGAIETFTAIPAPLEVALTRLDLAEVAHRRGDLEAASVHWRGAHEAFTALAVPRRVEQAERLASRLGLPLT